MTKILAEKNVTYWQGKSNPPKQCSGTARILEYSNGKRTLSFMNQWEYGSYIFNGYSHDVQDMIRDTAFNHYTSPDKLPDEMVYRLDIGNNVYLKAPEAREVFGWAKSYLINLVPNN